MEKYIVDRIEDNIAVLEKSINENVFINVEDLPGDISEGDVVIEKNGSYVICKEETEKRRKDIFEIQNKLFSE